jgi:hypothetical protein
MALEKVENGDTGSVARGKINAGLTSQDQYEGRIAALEAANVEQQAINDYFRGVIESKGIDENSVPVPINLTPDDIFVDVATLQKTGLTDGVYVISATMIIEPNQVKQPYLIRQVDDGIAYGGVSEYSSDNTNRIMEFYRTYYTVINGVMDFKMQGAVASGASAEIMIYSYTLLDYEMFLPETGGASGAGSHLNNKPPA